jgi:Ca2+-binding RTX toxin-like protein
MQIAGRLRMPVVSDYTALLSGYGWNGATPANQGRAVIVTYSFSTAPQPYLAAAGYSQDFINSFETFNAAEVTAARNAFAQWDAASGIRFVEVAAGTGTIQLGNFNFNYRPGYETAAGFASYPSITLYRDYGGFVGNNFISSFATTGDVFIKASYANNSSQASDFQHVLLHEIGHALGLKHPFEGTITLSPSFDTGSQSVMSYTSPRADMLGPLDIQAIQYLYGTNAADGSHVSSWSFDQATQLLTQTGFATADQLFGSYGKDFLSGGDGADVLAGFHGNDTLVDGNGNDTVFGGEGNDTLIGGAGDDNFYGSDGYGEAAGLFFDTVDYSAAASALTINLLFARYDGVRFYNVSGAGVGNDNLAEIDALRTGTGNDTVQAGAAALSVWSGGGADSVSGDAGNESFYGDTGNDTLVGGAGNDLLNGGTGLDSLNGGDGWDIASYADAAATVQVVMYNMTYNTGEAAGDILSGIEALQGSANIDILVGDFSINAILGGAGGDWIDGTYGGDYLYGEAGNDSLVSRNQADVIDGGADFDYVRYDFADAGLRAWLYSPAQNSGFAAGDTLTSVEGVVGSYFADDLRADNGVNALFGLGGNDFLVGLGGVDYMNGGAGVDTFYYTSQFDGGGTGDVIQDFVSGVDRIMVDGSQFFLGSPGGTALESWRFVAGLNATLATVQFGYDAATREVWYDSNGTGAGSRVTLATLQAGATMAAGDILVL